MIVFVAGMSRSGSMWIYNVTRALLTSANKIILPQDIPSAPHSLIDQAFSSAPQEDVVYCFKSHDDIAPNLPNTKIIITYRDVREAMFSYMHFTHCDFERGLKAAEDMMATTNYYFQEHNNNILKIRYERIVHEPLEVIEKIMQFLDLKINIEDSRKISEQFSKANIKKLLDSFNSITIDNYQKDINVQKNYELIPNPDGMYRIKHKKTGYQSNHITERGNKWRTELNEEQKNRLMAISSDWLTKYHFVL